MLNVSERIKELISNKKIHKRYSVVAGSLCILTAVGVVSSLIEPAISETEAEHINKALLLQINAEDINGEQTFKNGSNVKIYSAVENEDGETAYALKTDFDVTDEERLLALPVGRYRLVETLDDIDGEPIDFEVVENEDGGFELKLADETDDTSDTSSEESSADEISKADDTSKDEKADESKSEKPQKKKDKDLSQVKKTDKDKSSENSSKPDFKNPKVKVSSVKADPHMSSYSYANILSEYEVFTLEDFTGEGHFTGAVATGGKLDYAAHGGAGGGRVTADYAETLVRSVIEDDTGLNPNLYYKNVAEGVTPPAKSQQSDDYLDMQAAFTKLQEDSTTLSGSSNKTFAETDIDENGVLNIELSDNPNENNFEIPYEVWKKASKINVKSDTYKKDSYDWDWSTQPGTKVPNATNTLRCGLTVSVTGVETNELSFNGDGTTGMPITYNGDSFRDAIHGQEQYNFGGINILWNFPDATGDVKATSMAGHILAPQAHVDYAGGEGGAIGKSVTVSNEIHFFPFNGSGVPDTSKGSIKVKKKWENADGQDISAGAEKVDFDLYRVPNYNVKVNTTPVYDKTNQNSYLYYIDNLKSGSNVKITFDFGSEYANMQFPNNYGGRTDENGRFTFTADKISTVNGRKCIQVTHVGELSGADKINEMLAILKKATITVTDGNETEKNPYQDTYKVTGDGISTSISSTDSWETLINNLPTRDESGYTYEYYIKEKELDGWKTKNPDEFELITDGSVTTATITNTKKGDTPTPSESTNGKLVVQKEWLGPGDNKLDTNVFGESPLYVTVYQVDPDTYETYTEKTLSNGSKIDSSYFGIWGENNTPHDCGITKYGERLELSNSNDWTKILYPPLKNKNGNPYYYFVVENNFFENFGNIDNSNGLPIDWDTLLGDDYDESKKYNWETTYHVSQWGDTCTGCQEYDKDWHTGTYVVHDLLTNTASKSEQEKEMGLSHAENDHPNSKSDYGNGSGDDILNYRDTNQPTLFVIRNKIKAEDKNPVVMPETGSTGTPIYKIGGLTISGAGLLALIRSRRKKREDDK